MNQLWANNANSTLYAAITNVSTSLTVQTGDGALFPSPTGGQYFLASLCNVVSGIESNFEIVKVTARSGDIFTITRAQEGTSATGYLSGAKVSLRVTAGSINTWVDQTSAQTLSNKTLTSPSVNQLLDANGNVIMNLATTASAVNQVTVTDSVTTVAPSISATGTDTNISLNLVSKGTGVVQANGVKVADFSSAQTLTNKTFDSTSTFAAPLISYSLTNSVSAAGTTQGTATAVTTDLVNVTTCAAGAGVILPTTVVGRSISIKNNTANPCLVYPATGGAINALAANTAFSIPAGLTVYFGFTSTINSQTMLVGNGSFTGSGSNVLATSPTITTLTVSSGGVAVTGNSSFGTNSSDGFVVLNGTTASGGGTAIWFQSIGSYIGGLGQASRVSGSGTSTDILFQAQGSSNNLLLNSAGGVVALQHNGTTIASASSTGLAVTGALSATGATGSTSTLNDTNATYGVGQTYQYNSSAIGSVGSSKGIDSSQSITDLGINAVNNLTFATGYTTRMQLNPSGNLGLGVTPRAWYTSTPYSAFQMGTTAAVFGKASNEIAGMSSNVYYNSANVTTYIASGNYAEMYLQVGGQHQWHIAPTGTAGNAISFTQAMTLTNAGYLLVGYTSSNGSYDLQVNSQIFATSAIIATSDVKYKVNVKPIMNASELVMRFNPVVFNWQKHSVHNFDTVNRQPGFIAQEVREALKDTDFVGSVIKENSVTLPDETEEPFLGLTDSLLIPILTKALQEALIRIAALEAA